MKTHELKCLTPYFEATSSGAKPFDVRRDDRSIQKGDTVILREWVPDKIGSWEYSGREWTGIISFILTGGQFGIKGGVVVLGFGEIQ